MSFRRVSAGIAALLLMASSGAQQASAQLFGTGPWSGIYAGIHGGYGRSDDSTPSPTGLIGGFQAGYNLQLGNALIGVEADYTWTNMDGAATVPGVAIRTAVDAMWSARGRLGWVIANSVMLYGTAGYGGLDVAATAIVSGLTLTGNARYSGLVYGGGAEVLLTRNIMVRAEALRFDVDGNGAAAGDSATATQFRAALSYKF